MRNFDHNMSGQQRRKVDVAADQNFHRTDPRLSSEQTMVAAVVDKVKRQICIFSACAGHSLGLGF